MAADASVVGFVIDAHGPRIGYVFSAAYGAANAVTCIVGLPRLRTAKAPAAATEPQG